MITLSTPIQVDSTLGGASTISYNQAEVVQIYADPLAQTITGTVRLKSSSNAAAPIIIGSLSILTNNTVGTISIPNLNINIPVSLTNAEQTTVQGWITTLQNSIESGLISLGVVSGTQATGV